MRVASRVLLLLFMLNASVYARGVLAGTAVQNQADMLYIVGGIEYNLTTNMDTFLVDQIVDLEISWQDAAPVEVSSGETDRVLTFLLTNLGNGNDNFILDYEHNTSNSFSPPPSSVRIYQDSDGNGIFDIATDVLVTDINLSADANVTLFIVSDIPDANYTSSDLSHDGIKAESTSSASVGADNQDGVDVVVRNAIDVAVGVYVIRDFWLSSQKSAIIHSDDNQTHTGTIITYSIDLSIGGNADGQTIDAVILTDSIPTGTVYQAGSLRLDAVVLTDIVDADRGSCDGSVLRVDIGTLSGTAHQVLSFDVQVQ